jgi:uncharacterized protein (DUF849 family)
MKPTILTCAVTGASPMRANNPAIPYTPAEIAQEVIGAAKAGATIAHVHVRDPETGKPSMELAYYRETVERIRDSGVDIIINLTAGPGGRFTPSFDGQIGIDPDTDFHSPERRVEHVIELKPEMCTLDLNTNLRANGTSITLNLLSHTARMAELIQQAGVKPELEVFNAGDINHANELIRTGALKGRQLFQLVLGVKYSAPSTILMMQALKSLLPPDAEWAGFGISRLAFPMMAQSVLLGGHARTGFEDNIYLSRGVLAPNNAVLVERARRIIEDLGQVVATPDEGREILGLTKRG